MRSSVPPNPSSGPSGSGVPGGVFVRPSESIDETGRPVPTLARLVRRRLRAWFSRSRRDLPWRQQKDPYAIWISEIMLQQTTVAAVVPYYHRFLQAFPTLASLAAADEQEVLRLWEGLGYYRRARDLHRAAQQLASHPAGQIPNDPEALCHLPGMGRYTLARSCRRPSTGVCLSWRPIVCVCGAGCLAVPTIPGAVPRSAGFGKRPRLFFRSGTSEISIRPSWSSAPWCVRPPRRTANNAPWPSRAWPAALGCRRRSRPGSFDRARRRCRKPPWSSTAAPRSSWCSAPTPAAGPACGNFPTPPSLRESRTNRGLSDWPRS